MVALNDLITVAKFGTNEELKEMVKKGADLNERDSDGRSLLSLVSCIGRRDNAEILLSNGATFCDVQEKLYSAAEGNIPEYLLEAIEEGADVNAVSYYLEYTALMLAADNGSCETLEILIDKGADLEAKNDYGMTPLYIAAWSGKPECVKILIEKGADINACDQWGDSPAAAICGLEPPWEYAINAHSKEQLLALELLLEAGANPDLVNDDGETALDLAEKNTYISAANLLKNFCALRGKDLM